MDGGGGSGGRRPAWESQRGSWGREEQFRGLLQKAARKASRESIDTIADIAIRDDKVAYKAVVALIMHEMKALKPAYRLKLFFVASAILRQSRARRGERDKYAPRFKPLLNSLADLLAPLAADQLASVLKVLDVWWRDEVFDAPTVAALQTRLKGLLMASQAGGGAAGSSGGGGAQGMAASASGAGAAAPQHSSPAVLRRSPLSPGSLSGGGVAVGAASSLGPAAAPAAPAQPSQASLATGGTTAAFASATESLGSRPPSQPSVPLHTVGSSSQLMQQGGDAYDPLGIDLPPLPAAPAAAAPAAGATSAGADVHGPVASSGRKRKSRWDATDAQ
ncbi:splicing arginine serine-rich 15 [Micractinium conductrix]|uniref:Splicing arginine serine-rich 15 n=1 Tax=Micractinium conductrix TaxID=554055 RepID=A0A2P6V4Z4_9CHLO|nr:splicing arginine serine-rich 15 [Micractinium conductrix]|eukprot:PSC69158.1 splicing arginine serine-rich 15 [Micractinium conductrix]